MKNNYIGETFLDKVYKDLYNSHEVIQGYKNPSQKEKNIHEYMERLEHLYKKVLDSPRKNDIDLIKYLYYQKYVIKEEDIPDSYYKHQINIALEKGYGHIELTESKKKEIANKVIDEQKRSLDYWLEYFASEDSKVYPTWAKYWAFQGMLKLGSFDKETHEFTRRTKGTISPFIELNPEALSLSIDMLIKYIHKENIEDKELEKLIEKGVFGKIYAYQITKLEKIKKGKNQNNDGIWIKYSQNSNYDALVKSLQGKGTGWCTVSGVTAKNQLQAGDVYIYYSYDAKGEATIPRIAIRMEGDKIAEVRGIARNQNLETEMEEIADKKLNEFLDYAKYKYKINDMKKLTKIYKDQLHRNLSTEELRFLYEIDRPIIGFGFFKDPRINEIISSRDVNKDYSVIISTLDPEQDCRYDLDLKLIKSGKGIKFPKVFNGNINLNQLEIIDDLELPEILNGDLHLFALTNTKGLILPKELNGGLYLNELKSVEGLTLPKKLKGNLSLQNLTSIQGLEMPEYFDGSLFLSELTSAKGLKLPKELNGDIYLNKLESAEGLVLPEVLNGDLNLYGITTTQGLKLPKELNGRLLLGKLESAKGLVLPEVLNGDLNLYGLKSGENLELPEILNGNLSFLSLKNAKELRLPKQINGHLYLNNLIDIEGLKLPEVINGNLVLNESIELSKLVLPVNFKCEYIFVGYKRIYPDDFYKYQKNINQEESKAK